MKEIDWTSEREAERLAQMGTKINNGSLFEMRNYEVVKRELI